MSHAVAFIDTLAPRPYSGAPGALAGLGGTEATLVRVCQALAPDIAVQVCQAARAVPTRIGAVDYAPLDLARLGAAGPRTLVVINAWKVAAKLARRHPAARVLLWLHVFPGRHNRAMGPALAAAGVEVICVSARHAAWLRGFLGQGPRPRIDHIHNPIADDLAPDDTPRDRDLLLFASAPHKGLGQVFRRFEALRDTMPSLRLAVADPGYLAWPTGPMPEGVMPLGRLDQGRLLGWMRRSLCLFYPQDRFAETFGLVIAEANAVGCPALLHRGLGANDEVASGPEQCIDTADPAAIRARVAAWRAAPDTVQAGPRPAFRLSAVAARWRDRLTAPAPTRPVFPTLTLHPQGTRP